MSDGLEETFKVGVFAVGHAAPCCNHPMATYSAPADGEPRDVTCVTCLRPWGQITVEALDD